MKTKESATDVSAFIASLKSVQQRVDSTTLVSVMKEASGQPAVMWGPSIIGFGKHRYPLANGKVGEICAIGFSPRAKAFSLYVSTEFEGSEDLMMKLGKHKRGNGGCIYINKLDDIDADILRALVEKSYAFKTVTSIPV